MCIEDSRIQSIFKYLQVMYHAEFEKTKGKLTQVADDPETLRIKQNSRIIRYFKFYDSASLNCIYSNIEFVCTYLFNF